MTRPLILAVAAVVALVVSVVRCRPEFRDDGSAVPS